MMENKLDFTPYKDDEINEVFMSKLTSDLGGTQYRLNDMFNISDRSTFTALQVKIEKKWHFMHDGKRAWFFENKKTAKKILKILKKNLVTT